jgi:exodeoxyribonuclease VII small subunit
MSEEIEPSFEEALSQLERIVAELERGGSDLTAALGRYESGIRLLRRCHGLLDQAEQSVALLTGVDADGEPITSPFDAGATLAKETVSGTIATTTVTVATASEAVADLGVTAPLSAASRAPVRKAPKRPREPEPEFDPDTFDPPF